MGKLECTKGGRQVLERMMILLANHERYKLRGEIVQELIEFHAEGEVLESVGEIGFVQFLIEVSAKSKVGERRKGGDGLIKILS